MIRRAMVAIGVAATILWCAVLQAQSVTYIYDAAGRLVGVVAPSGESAIYTYDAAGNLLSIQRLEDTDVAIVDFTPASGPVGTAVTLYGTGFSATPSENTVTFDGTSASVISSTTTSILVTVPDGADTGPIGVTSPLGSATSGTPFEVAASDAPAITGFSPTMGPEGTAFSITGVNFDPVLSQNRLAINLTRAWPTDGSPTEIDAMVPAQGGSGKVSIRTASGEAVSADDFFVTPSP